MSDRIEPALTPDQWAIVQEKHLRVENVVPILTVPADMPRIIAVANYAMLDDQPGKITRDWIALLRSSVHRTSCASFDDSNPSTAECDCDGPRLSRQIAAALESYLPPAP